MLAHPSGSEQALRVIPAALSLFDLTGGHGQA
jgi:hypothetical protein